MFASVQERLSDALLRMGAERALDRQRMERSIVSSVDPNSPGYGGALAALRTAEMFDSTLLWLGWRLQPSDLARYS
jgi:hypothetical protein